LGRVYLESEHPAVRRTGAKGLIRHAVEVNGSDYYSFVMAALVPAINGLPG
jgi:hypothetical protein